MKRPEPEAFLKSKKSLSQPFLRLSIVFGYLGGALVVAQAWMIATIAQDVVFEDKSFHEIRLYLGVLMGIFAARFLLLSLSGFYGVKAASRLKKRLRSKLYTRLKDRGPLFITGHGSGAIVNAVADGVETVGKYYSDFLPAKALMAVVPLTILLVVLPTDWLSALVMVLTAPLIPVFMILIGKGAEKLNQRQWQKLARLGNHFLNVIQGLPTLKLFNASKNEAAAIAQTSEEYRRETMKVLRLAFLSSVTLEFFSTVSIAIVAVLIGFRLMWGDMVFFNGFFVLLLAPEFYLPLRKMGAAYHARMEAIGAADKIVEIMQDEKRDEDCADGNLFNTLRKEPVSIRFEDVTHAYDGRGKAIESVSFQLAPGTHMALVGPSGAGKSTILSLILGFVRLQEGRILIDGKSIHDIDLAVWRKSVGWIPQIPNLFYGSVLENIRMGKKDASDNDVFALCSHLKIDAFIKSLPQGYETVIGEQGYGLSGGQAQRIAIARAFLRDAPLILMDEPTASLDQETEDILSRAMRSLTRKKSVITIAHRIHTIENADQILFLKNGRIVAKGTHHELTEKNENYRMLVDRELLQGLQA